VYFYIQTGPYIYKLLIKQFPPLTLETALHVITVQINTLFYYVTAITINYL